MFINRGMTLSMGPMAIPGPLRLSKFGSATSVGATITYPANILEGDLAVLFDQGFAGANPPTAVLPAGFVNFLNSSSGSTNIRSYFSYKLCDGTEGGTTITGMDGASNDDKVLIIFRGFPSKIRGVTIPTWTNENVNTNPIAQTVTVAGSDLPMIVFGVYKSDGTLTGVTYSPTEDESIASSVRSRVYYNIYNSSPANASVDQGDGGGNSLSSGLIVCY